MELAGLHVFTTGARCFLLHRRPAPGIMTHGATVRRRNNVSISTLWQRPQWRERNLSDRVQIACNNAPLRPTYKSLGLSHRRCLMELATLVVIHAKLTVAGARDSSCDDPDLSKGVLVFRHVHDVAATIGLLRGEPPNTGFATCSLVLVPYTPRVGPRPRHYTALRRTSALLDQHCWERTRMNRACVNLISASLLSPNTFR